jgi:SAM-dependent methyltransferase
MSTPYSIDNMKKFHNNIKNELLKTAKKLSRGYTLLDIGSGRGGDMHKWKNIRLKSVLAIDNNRSAIIEANRRLNTQRGDKNAPNIRYAYHDVAVDSISIDRIESNIRGNTGKYDIISCQFSMNYFSPTLENLIYQVGNKLNPGGVFIGTVCSADKVIDKLYSTNEYKSELLELKRVSNEMYSFNIAEGTSAGTYFDVFGESLEYYIFKEQLARLFILNNLQIINMMDFQEWYNIYNDRNPMSRTEMEISFMYFSFIVQKI